MTPGEIKRLHWGCGSSAEPGWINSDIKAGPGVDLVADIRDGLPLESDSIDYAVSIHALQEFSYPEIVPVLQELRRMLKPGGVLRMGLPDLIKGVAAYQAGNRRYFRIPDKEVKSIGAKLVVQLVWYGYNEMVFTSEFIEEMLFKAGFKRVDHCHYKETASPFPEILQLDNREEESLFVEAVK